MPVMPAWALKPETGSFGINYRRLTAFRPYGLFRIVVPCSPFVRGGAFMFRLHPNTVSVQCQGLFFLFRYKINIAIKFKKSMLVTMKAKIELFTALDTIAKKHDITDEDWAKRAKIRRPSISELRRMGRIDKEKSLEKIGRACTIEKISALFIGLNKLIGGDVLRNDLRAVIDSEKDQDIRMMLWALILRDAPKETKDSVESNMKIAAQTIITKHK